MTTRKTKATPSAMLRKAKASADKAAAMVADKAPADKAPADKAAAPATDSAPAKAAAPAAPVPLWQCGSNVAADKTDARGGNPARMADAMAADLPADALASIVGADGASCVVALPVAGRYVSARPMAWPPLFGNAGGHPVADGGAPLGPVPMLLLPHGDQPAAWGYAHVYPARDSNTAGSAARPSVRMVAAAPRGARLAYCQPPAALVAMARAAGLTD